ncbi:site-specific DNA-methyltransferase [uncultured Pontibacter sp.]|uniref:site-specific DNA-methyltransferase n=1 Tax=uncultured Pontibacter sp. TaxID=453356 RepID=UPI002611BDEC|nr:site-specific DNA-methyltransferase [uncultured Pontibacter sp.]
MPTLHWIGKEKVVNHHRDVPFRVLEQTYTFSTDQSTPDSPAHNGENKIIHGDNLEALKALLPEYEGRVKCIYIDPPYNTGNEAWVYNDNVNDPKIQRWLQQVVGKEGEDLTRHDKWLCMMYPRLKLLHKLLADDGAIFISIDDNEQANLKLVMDEIFGMANFVSTIIWQKVYAPKNSAKFMSEDHDFILTYSKNINQLALNKLPRNDEQVKRYKNPDNDYRGLWKPGDLSARNYYGEGTYSITTPSGRVVEAPPKGTYWRVSQKKFKQMDADNRIWWGEDGNNVPAIKRFLSEVQDGVVPQTLWKYDEVGHTQLAKKELIKVLTFGSSDDVFVTPKPVKLIDRILKIASDKDSIILDSFAGSGTTAHAVLNLNKEDGGNRKFILVEMEDYAEGITAERVKRVMQGYGEGSKAVSGTGGSFSYYELGEPLFDEHQNLNEAVGAPRIQEYIWYTETRTPYPAPIPGQDLYLLGSLHGTAYYFVYEPSHITNLDYDFLATITHRAEQYVIYADNCLLPKEMLQKHNIVFKKIPRDISRF